jgi:hypothetical protein
MFFRRLEPKKPLLEAGLQRMSPIAEARQKPVDLHFRNLARNRGARR